MEVTEHYEFDSFNRMLYNPEFHFSHGKPFSESDLEYVCKFHEVDTLRAISFAVGKTETSVANKISQLKRTGKYGYYKRLNKYWGFVE